MEEKMELKEAADIFENMCLRYGKPNQKGRTAEQIREITALNVILKEIRK